MNEIERYLDRICRSVSGPNALRAHLREELREHLEETIDALVAGGLSQAEATKRALEEFGQPDAVREELETVHGRRHLALLIEKAMEWKEKTMKTEWKWQFAAQFLLIVLLAVQVVLFVWPLIYLIPHITAIYMDIGRQPEHAFFQAFHRVAVFLVHDWYLLVVPLALVWGIFEWKSRSQYKALVRLTAGAAASLVLTGLIFWQSLAVGVAYATILPDYASAVALSAYDEAIVVDEAIKDIRRAIESNDRAPFIAGLTELGGNLPHRGAVETAALGGIDPRREEKELRKIWNVVASLRSNVDHLRAQALSRSQPGLESSELDQFETIVREYDLLREMLPHWPRTMEGASVPDATPTEERKD